MTVIHQLTCLLHYFTAHCRHLKHRFVFHLNHHHLNVISQANHVPRSLLYGRSDYWTQCWLMIPAWLSYTYSKYFIGGEMLDLFSFFRGWGGGGGVVYFPASLKLKTRKAVGSYKGLILAFSQVEHILAVCVNVLHWLTKKKKTNSHNPSQFLHPTINTCRGCVDARSDYFMRGVVKHRQEISLQDVVGCSAYKTSAGFQNWGLILYIYYLF